MAGDDALETSGLHELVDRLQLGDAVARNELIRRSQRQLESLARAMLRNYPGVHRWEETHDVFQNAVMKLLRALESIRPANRRAYYGLAAEQIRRVLIDFARHHRNNAGCSVERSDIADAGPTHDDLDDWLAFHEAVEKLPAKEREVIALVYYHDWKQKDIADLLQVDERTIRRYFDSARTMLRERLGKDWPP